jgi:dTDP-4-amino-4,6-dideoxygalactose transaminase
MKKIKSMIPLFKVFMAEDVPDKVSKILMSGYIGQGPVVDEFEELLKSYFGHDWLVTTNAATSAEHLALHMLRKPTTIMEMNHTGDGAVSHKWDGIKTGDEVLCTPLTCTATNWPVLANGLKIKWVDVDPKTLNMDLDDLARKITKDTKIIYLVHWGGYPIDLDKVKEIQDKTQKMVGFRPMVIEDCAHSIGSFWKGKPLGNHGNICTFSLQAIKHVTSIDGGILTLPNQDLYRRAKLLRWYGIDRETNKKDFRCEADVAEWGFKFHMNDVNACVGMENFQNVGNIIDRHVENAEYYNKELNKVAGVTLTQQDMRYRKSSYWIYSMLVDNKQQFMNKMKECNIMVSQVHERNDIHTCVSDYKAHLPNLDKIQKQLICIPNGWWVTDEQREYIVDCIKEGW